MTEQSRRRSAERSRSERPMRANKREETNGNTHCLQGVWKVDEHGPGDPVAQCLASLRKMRESAQQFELEAGFRAVVDSEDLFEDLAALRVTMVSSVGAGTKGQQLTRSTASSSMGSIRDWSVSSMSALEEAATGSRARRRRTTTKAATSPSLSKRGLQTVHQSSSPSISTASVTHEVAARSRTTLSILVTQIGRAHV